MKNNNTLKSIAIQIWEDFINKEQELASMIDNQEENEKIFSFIHEIFPIDGLAFEYAARQDKGYEIVLSSDGDEGMLWIIGYLKKCMPASIPEHWQIVFCKPSGDFTLRMGDVEIDSTSVDVWFDKNNHYMDIKLYSKKLQPLKEQDENQYEHILWLLLDATLGELPLFNSVGKVEFIDHAFSEKSITLDCLLDVLKAEGLSVKESFDLDEVTYSTYQVQPNESEDYKLREDIYVGSISLINILNDYFNKETYLIDTLNRNGCSAFFVGYSNDFLENNENLSDVLLDYRDHIDSQIINKCGENVATYIGGASGIYNSYIDYIVWDRDEFIKAVKAVLSNEKSSYAFIQEYTKASETILVGEG